MRPVVPIVLPRTLVGRLRGKPNLADVTSYFSVLFRGQK